MLGSRTYSTAVDLWGVGCIFAELATRRPLFPGDSEIDQLYRIFKLMGTPNEQDWPGVSELPDYKATFPKWERKQLINELPQLDQFGIDLLVRLLQFDPAKRLSARAALRHIWFFDRSHQ